MKFNLKVFAVLVAFFAVGQVHSYALSKEPIYAEIIEISRSSDGYNYATVKSDGGVSVVKIGSFGVDNYRVGDVRDFSANYQFPIGISGVDYYLNTDFGWLGALSFMLVFGYLLMFCMNKFASLVFDD